MSKKLLCVAKSRLYELAAGATWSTGDGVTVRVLRAQRQGLERLGTTSKTLHGGRQDALLIDMVYFAAA